MVNVFSPIQGSHPHLSLTLHHSTVASTLGEMEMESPSLSQRMKIFARWDERHVMHMIFEMQNVLVQSKDDASSQGEQVDVDFS